MKTRKGLPKKGKEDAPKKETGLGVFDFVNDINFGKKNLIRNSENPALAEKLYNPFMTNRALSNFMDTVLLANLANSMSHLDSKLQYEFLLHSVRSKKRFSKWYKQEKDDTLELLAKHYGCNIRRAKEIASLLSESQIEAIKESYYTGGVVK